MKVVIHGTNGGYKALNSLGTFNDVRPDNNKSACIGQKAYSIQYFESNVVFSKYLFIRDVLGDKRTGNIAFSLVIPQSKKLSGENVIEILDRVSEEFSNKHISSDNLDSFREDWQFVEKITNEYKDLIDINREEQIFNSGSLESAYLYFNIKNSLKEYFELPYQDEYKVFKQVFLIDSKYIGKDENPVNALRHDSNSNLTDRIDLNKYTLKCNSKANYGDSDVKVSVNSLSKKKVSLDEILDIEISEKYKHRKIIQSAIKEDSNYIKIDHKAKIVSVEIDKIDLEDVLIDFEFEIQNENGERLKENFDIYKQTQSTLTTSNNGNWVKSENSKLSVKEKELDDNHLFIYIKTNSASSFIREIKKEDSGQIIKLIVRSSFKLNIRKEHSNLPLDNCKIEYENKTVNSDIISFETPDEIRRIYNLKITHPDYHTIVLNNYYLTENGAKTIYLPKNKINTKDKTKSTEKTKETNDHDKRSKRKKKENDINDWFIYIGVSVISCAFFYGIYWTFKFLNRPNYINEIELVNQPKPSDDTIKIGKDDTTVKDKDVLKDSNDKPKNSNDKPKNGNDKPKDGNVKPKDGNDKPKDGNDKPKDGNDKPKDGNDKPKDGNVKPKDGNDKPKDGNDKPKDGSDIANGEKNSSKSFEKDFLRYIKMSDPKIKNFQDLLKRVTKKNFKYYDQLKKISNKSGFERFITNNDDIDRLNAKDLTDIKF